MVHLSRKDGVYTLTVNGKKEKHISLTNAFAALKKTLKRGKIMGKVICGSCGAVIDADEIVLEDAYMCDSDVERCPECRRAADFYEAEECEICGEYHISEDGCDDVEMFDGVCKECLLKASVDECKEVAKKEGKHIVEINAFLACSFTAAEIEDILTEALKKEPKDAVKEYVEGDPSWFADVYKEVRAKWNS